MTGRIVLLSSSPRVAAGLLSWPAWELLRSQESRVYVGDPRHHQLPALHAAGVAVRLLTSHGEQPLPTAEDRSGTATAESLAAAAPEIAEQLYARASYGDLVVWLSGADGDPGLGEALAQRLVGGSSDAGGTGATALVELELLPGSYDLPGGQLVELVQVMDRLRRECPWVQAQTHRSLVRYLVEEAYETVEALEADDRTHLREELGDLLFQVVFHARLAEEYPDPEQDPTDLPDGEDPDTDAEDETGPWSIDDVAAALTEKLIRRNPHVFGGEPGAGTLTTQEIENVWDQLKSEEKRRGSVFDGLPPGLPALALADKVLERADRAGLTLSDLQHDQDTGPELADDRTATTVGDELLGVVVQARRAGIDPEQALRDAIRRRLPPDA